MADNTRCLRGRHAGLTGLLTIILRDNENDIVGLVCRRTSVLWTGGLVSC